MYPPALSYVSSRYEAEMNMKQMKFIAGFIEPIRDKRVYFLSQGSLSNW